MTSALQCTLDDDRVFQVRHMLVRVRHVARGLSFRAPATAGTPSALATLSSVPFLMPFMRSFQKIALASLNVFFTWSMQLPSIGLPSPYFWVLIIRTGTLKICSLFHKLPTSCCSLFSMRSPILASIFFTTEAPKHPVALFAAVDMVFTPAFLTERSDQASPRPDLLFNRAPELSPLLDLPGPLNCQFGELPNSGNTVDLRLIPTGSSL